MIIENTNEEELLAFASRLAHSVDNGATLFLSGPLGAGKTTFARGFLHGLGYTAKVKSPTYTIVEPYLVGERQVYHFDLYRLKHADELEFIGIKEYFSEHSICLIEWPEKGFPLLPVPDLACYIEITGLVRNVRLETHSKNGESILRRL